jgi:DNA end-binding protein Ku
MSPRAIASATVSFGLVSIPVKVFSSGNTSSAIHFNGLHKKCGSRLKQQYFCPQDGEKVERADMAKGYEFSKGQYVLFSEDELKALSKKSSGHKPARAASKAAAKTTVKKKARGSGK